MKKLLLIAGIGFICQSNAQNAKTITAENYQQLKQQNKLDKNVKYVFENQIVNAVQTKNKPHQVHQVDTAGSNCSCLVPLDGTFDIVPMNQGTPPYYRNDDGSSALIPLNFNFSYYGTVYNSCYINNNGNITFLDNQSSFSSTGFPNGSDLMIAPFWADVDTRNSASGLVYYKQENNHMIVKWDEVGYYSQQADKLNTFQLIISDGTDSIIPGNNNIAFCYGDMQWTTGSASMGVNGFGGIPATVGVNKGDNASYAQIGRFDTSGIVYEGSGVYPDSVWSGADWLDNRSFYFNTEFANIPPIAYDSLCDTLVPVFDAFAMPFRIHMNAMGVNDQISYSVLKQPVGSIINPVVNGSFTTLYVDYVPQQLGLDTLLLEYTDNSGVINQHMRVFDVQSVSPVGLDKNDNEHIITVFPNPVSHTLNVKVKDEQKIDSIKLIDMMGVTVYETMNPEKEKTIVVDQLRKGIYTIVVKETSGKLHSSRIVVQ